MGICSDWLRDKARTNDPCLCKGKAPDQAANGAVRSEAFVVFLFSGRSRSLHCGRASPGWTSGSGCCSWNCPCCCCNHSKPHWSCCSARNGSALYWCFCCFSPCPFTSFQSSVSIVFGVSHEIILTSQRFSRRNIRSKKRSFRWIQSYFSHKFSIKLKKTK